MSRVFWVAVGAVGGIVAYRRGTQAAARAKELGPLGTAQVAAHTTSRLAGRAAHGLGRLNDLKARREGRLVAGTAEELTAEAHQAHGAAAPPDTAPAPPHAQGPAAAPRPAADPGGSPTARASGRAAPPAPGAHTAPGSPGSPTAPARGA